MRPFTHLKSWTLVIALIICSIGHAEHAVDLPLSVAPLVVGARPHVQSEDYTINREAYESFTNGISTKESALEKKSGADQDFYNQIKATMLDIKNTNLKQPYAVKCVEWVSHGKTTFDKGGGLSWDINSPKDEDNFHRFDAVIVNEGKGKFLMRSSRIGQDVEKQVEKWSTENPVSEQSTEAGYQDGHSDKRFYLGTSKPLPIEVKMASLKFNIGGTGNDTFHFSIKPLTADGDVYFKISKKDIEKVETTEKGEKVQSERRTEITCK